MELLELMHEQKNELVDIIAAYFEWVQKRDYPNDLMSFEQFISECIDENEIVTK